MKNKIYTILRIAFGWIFLWAFLDKTFGLGFSTVAEKAWIHGGSPTAGFLSFATKGPFVELFQSLSGNILVDILFMAGLLGIGVSFIFNIYVKYSGWCAALLMILMYISVLPPETNPLVDEHVIYALLAVHFALSSKNKNE